MEVQKADRKCKVVAFWSYKGGTGRSLALANTAYALARLGKDVAALDLDVDSPGLTYKFGIPVVNEQDIATLGSGFVDILNDRLAAHAHKKKPAVSIKDCVVTIRVKENPDRPVPGVIHLIPAGDLSAKYWEIAAQQRLGNVFYQQDTGKLTTQNDLLQYVTGKMTDEHAGEFRKLLEAMPPEPMHSAEKTEILKDVIHEIMLEKNLTPPPEYILIDVTSGISELQGIALQLWADKVVALFSPNSEGLFALKRILPSIRQIKRDTRQPVEVIPVLSRIGNKRLHEVSDQLDEFVRIAGVPLEDLCVIHEDRYLELHEEIALRRNLESPHPYIYRQVCNNYIDLVSRILADSPLDSQRDKRLAQQRRHKNELRQVLEVPEETLQQELVFALFQEMGSIVNIADNARNVSFKVDTFTTLLGDIENSLRDILGKARGRQVFYSALGAAGREAGTRFGHSLMLMWDRGSKQLSERADGALV